MKLKFRICAKKVVQIHNSLKLVVPNRIRLFHAQNLFSSTLSNICGIVMKFLTVYLILYVEIHQPDSYFTKKVSSLRRVVCGLKCGQTSLLMSLKINSLGCVHLKKKNIQLEIVGNCRLTKRSCLESLGFYFIKVYLTKYNRL